MKLAATKIPFEKLHEALGLADDVNIEDIFLNNDDRYMRTVHLILGGNSPVLSEHQEGSQIATNPLYHFQNIQPLYSPSYYDSPRRIPDRQGFYQGIMRYL